MPRDDATLLDIDRAAFLVEEFTRGIGKSAFESDLKTQSAVLHQLTIIGEAVKRLSAEYRALHPEVPWRGIAGMRDFLIHAYHAVDLNQVWETATKDVPALRTALRPFLPYVDTNHE